MICVTTNAQLFILQLNLTGEGLLTFIKRRLFLVIPLLLIHFRISDRFPGPQSTPRCPDHPQSVEVPRTEASPSAFES